VVTRGSPEHLDLAEASLGRVRTEYVAGGKEKLEDVAKKFGMRKYDLARINRISYDTVLAKGDKVIVYQVADPARSERASKQWKKTPKARRGKLAGEPARRTATATPAAKPAPAKAAVRAPAPAAAKAPAKAAAKAPAKAAEKAPAPVAAKAPAPAAEKAPAPAAEKAPAKAAEKAPAPAAEKAL